MEFFEDNLFDENVFIGFQMKKLAEGERAVLKGQSFDALSWMIQFLQS